MNSSCKHFDRYRKFRTGGSASFLMFLACAALLFAAPMQARAQDNGDPNTGNIDSNAGQSGNVDNPQNQDSNAGPVRMARFSYIKGDVTWRGGSEASWSSAVVNFPLRQGAQIWVSDNSRAEVQFDDGSRLRLDSNSLVTLQTLYSDSKGEFTEITLNDGLAGLRLTNQYSIYQVNTPLASVKSAGPSRLRVGAGEGVQIVVRRGQATVEGANGSGTLNAGDYVDLLDNTTPYTPGPAPNMDSFDVWTDRRDSAIDGFGQRPSHSYLPPNIALCADELDTYGTWRDDPTYGHVWCPRVTAADWRPYAAGHWTWVDPFGWTWVAEDRWGWAPYHYGTWVHAGYGWGWVPGPATQYWSPAVVSFSQCGDRMVWCPLGPREVHYPSVLSVGFRSGNWSLFFSIGGAAVYYPGDGAYCVARPWSARYVNSVTYINHVTNITVVNRNYYAPRNFVSVNASFGATGVSVAGFAGRGVYQPVSREVVVSGRAIGAPEGGRPFAGPQAVHPSVASYTPTRSFQPAARVPQSIVNRSVYRAPLPATVTRSAPMSGQHFVSGAGSRPTSISRPNQTNPGGFTRPNNGNRPINTQPGPGANPIRPNNNNPGGNAGRDAALQQYLKERAQRNQGGTNPNGNTNPNRNNVPSNAPNGNTNPNRNNIPNRDATPNGNANPNRNNIPNRETTPNGNTNPNRNNFPNRETTPGGNNYPNRNANPIRNTAPTRPTSQSSTTARPRQVDPGSYRPLHTNNGGSGRSSSPPRENNPPRKEDRNR